MSFFKNRGPCFFILPKSSISGASLSVMPTSNILIANNAKAVITMVHFALLASVLSVNPNLGRSGRGLGIRLLATTAANGTAVAIIPKMIKKG